MIVYDLICAQEHVFEGWFASSEDYDRQRERTLVRCPLCDDGSVTRRPSANIAMGRTEPVAENAAQPTSPEPQKQAAAALTAMRTMMRNAEDVGPRFADEARKIHYEESPQRNIRGQASAQEAVSLREEGVEFMSVPDFLVKDLN